MSKRRRPAESVTTLRSDTSANAEATGGPSATEIYETIKEAITNVANVRSASPWHSMLAREIIDEMARNAAQGVLELIRVASERRVVPGFEDELDGHQPRWNVAMSRVVACTCGLMFTSQNTDYECAKHIAAVSIIKKG